MDFGIRKGFKKILEEESSPSQVELEECDISKIEAPKRQIDDSIDYHFE